MTANPRDLLEGTTPGPWKVKETQWDLGVILPNGFSIHLIDGSDTIVPEDVANARLIAAAPDLARRLAEAEASLRLILPTVRGLKGAGTGWFWAWAHNVETLLAGMPKEDSPC